MIAPLLALVLAAAHPGHDDPHPESERVFIGDGFRLEGDFEQGGLVFGEAEPGTQVFFGEDTLMVSEEGRFVFGFGRDAGEIADLVIIRPDGAQIRKPLAIAPRDWPVSRIDGLPPSKVDTFTEEQLAKIGEDRKKKNAARALVFETTDWSGGFDWPATGRISGVFGSKRILNGNDNGRFHSGLDIAAPAGTPIKAPAAGTVTLAEADMYFEGGLVLLDHGHRVESAFLHMSRLDVEPGERVEKGDVIGAVGSTGRSTGPHLHWSIRWNGTLVDPRPLLGDMPTAE